jgi:Family of unknown function (DUF6491)
LRQFLTPCLLASVTLVAACASTGPAGAPPAPSSWQRALERYSAYAGAPVNSFNWLGRFDSWEALGKDQLVVYTTPRDAYLLKVAPPCDLRFVVGAVGITSTNTTVYQGLDSIVVRDRAGGGPWQCAIQQIRPIDVRRMKADRVSDSPSAVSDNPSAKGSS